MLSSIRQRAVGYIQALGESSCTGADASEWLMVFGGGHSPVELTPNSMPEPDVAVIRGEPEAYSERLPRASDVVLAVEIAITTLAADRAKASLYARGGVSDYWLFNVAERRLETYADPSGDSYGRVLSLAEEQHVTLPGLTTTWLVRDLFPAAR